MLKKRETKDIHEQLRHSSNLRERQKKTNDKLQKILKKRNINNSILLEEEIEELNKLWLEECKEIGLIKDIDENFDFGEDEELDQEEMEIKLLEEEEEPIEEMLLRLGQLEL